MSIGSRENPYDLVIVGGGINGCGMARDAAKRGLDVAMFEKHDFSTGATWASSGMIHGGIRYLSSDPNLTKRSCKDAAYIRDIAPHLTFRIPFMFPVRGDTAANRVFLELTEVYFDTYDRYAHKKGGKPHSRLTGDEARQLEPSLPDDVIGAVTTDEWGIDPSRLTVINARDAEDHGADIHTYHEVESFIQDDGSADKRGRILGVEVEDQLARESREVYGDIVFNATGPWAEETANMAGAEMCRVRPGKGIHLVLSGRVTNYAIISKAVDGRQVFLAPHQNVTYIGTTDDDYWGDLDDIPILEDEVEYLLDAARRVVPEIDDYRIIDTTVGCRPTLYGEDQYESDLSRDHAIFDHAEEGLPGFMSMAGGKLAEYRLMAEEAVDAVVDNLDVEVDDCTTHQDNLPGGDETNLEVSDFTALDLDQYSANRILYRHGSEAEHIWSIIEESPSTSQLIDSSEPVTEAELRYAIRHEGVKRLDDCKRRCRLGVGIDGGWQATLRAARIFCDEVDRSISPREAALNFQQRRWRTRRPVVSDQTLSSEWLGQYWFFGDGVEPATSETTTDE
jgi:glycerol-3-phosphate dehydrogenase